jgi:Ca2+-binding EF-hand superfamily protein
MSRAFAFIGALVFVPALAFAQQPCTTDARHVVNEIYRHMLERAADPDSKGWVDMLTSGKGNVRDVVREIVTSQEHQERFGRANSDDSVAALYRHILGRQPDPGGLRGFVQIGQTRGLAAVVDQMLGSAEYNQNFGAWGVPGSGGVRYCGAGASSSSTATQSAPSSSASNMNMRFRGMDTNRDGRIARNEWRGNPQAFRNHDWNNDGMLSGDEVSPGARVPDEADENDLIASGDHRFDYLDVDNDGRIEQDEWDGSTQAFARLDRNRDGRLNRAELGTGVTPFRTLDDNNDGRIALDEWRWSRRAFERLDDDGDGFLTRREYRTDGAAATTGRFR